jgi:histidine triad (HIT) family protein
MYNKDNLFAKIIRKEIPCEIVYEDERVLFIKDKYPRAKIHILAMPKLEAMDFNDFILKADEDMVGYFFSKIQKVIKEEGIEKSGFKIIINSGRNGEQEVPHFHVHVLGGENVGILK